MNSTESYFDQLRAIENLHNVSRETFTSLEDFATLLLKWNKAINLVGKSTINDLWQRHIMDSAQLVSYLPDTRCTVTDFGSGGGFPAIVLSLLTNHRFHLIESDKRKAAFLETTKSLSHSNVTIHAQRIETLTPWETNIITARALAPLSKLVSMVEKFIHKNTTCLFLKGKQVHDELKDFNRYYQADEVLYPSITSPDAYIIRLTNIQRR